MLSRLKCVPFVRLDRIGFSSLLVAANRQSVLTRTYRPYSSTAQEYYKLFPQTFPNGPPPASSFSVDNRKLRREYRKLQATNHPDLNNELNKNTTAAETSISSSLINKAYDTLNDPLKRSQYLLKEEAGIDLNSDEATHKYQFADQTTLMEILEIHENLEDMTKQAEADEHKKANDTRIEESIARLNELYTKNDYDAIALETIRLKYWYNIKNVLKEWVPGMPITLTH